MLLAPPAAENEGRAHGRVDPELTAAIVHRTAQGHRTGSRPAEERARGEVDGHRDRDRPAGKTGETESMLAKVRAPPPAAGASVIVPVPALSNVSRFRRNGLAMSLVAV